MAYEHEPLKYPSSHRSFAANLGTINRLSTCFHSETMKVNQEFFEKAVLTVVKNSDYSIKFDERILQTIGSL